MRMAFVPSLNLSGFDSRFGAPKLDSLVPPLGVLTLAAVIENAGHRASIVDLNYEIKQRALELDSEFYRLAARRVLEANPEIVGFSTMCNSFHISLELAQEIKRQQPSTIVLLGGPQVSYCAEDTLQTFPFVDYVIRGEAEHSLPTFLSALKSEFDIPSVRGLTFRGPDGIVSNLEAQIVDNLDELPFPAWHQFPYQLDGGFSIDVGRGCPFACTFCSTSNFFHRRFRLKSFARITAEVEYLQERYGAGAITFVHDLFTANRKWVRAFCQALKDAGTTKPFIWSASARIDTVDAALLNLMGEVGCRALFYGIESGSQRLQMEVKKRLKVHSVVPVAQATLAANIEPTLSFIAGFPTETVEDIECTFDVIGALLPLSRASIQLHLMSPQLGTPDINRFFDNLKFDGYLSDIAAGANIFLRDDWFAQYPSMFASFYYFNNQQLPRDHLRGADQFVLHICNNMRHTIAFLLKHNKSLWKIYHGWRKWTLDDRQAGYHLARAGSQYNSNLQNAYPVNHTAEVYLTADEWLISFVAHVESDYTKVCTQTDRDNMRDEILAFYLRQYHSVDVREPLIPAHSLVAA